MQVAIIGAGLMGYWHGRTARQLGARLVAVVDPDAARASTLARRLRADRTAEDASDILKQDRVDAVHICSPRSTHAALARGAIEAGIHAFVEKPLVDSAEETRRLVDLARRREVILCPVHQIAFQDGLAQAAHSLARLGDVSIIDIRICSAGGIDRTKLERDEILADILPHPLSVLRRLWPRVELETHHWFVSSPGAGELSVSGLHGGAHLSLLISLNARPTRFEMTVSGAGGTIQLDFFHGFAVHHGSRVSRFDKAARPFEAALKLFGAAAGNLHRRGWSGEFAYPGLRRLTGEFYAAARGERPAPFRAEDIIAVAAARDTILIGSEQKPPPVRGTAPILASPRGEARHFPRS